MAGRRCPPCRRLWAFLAAVNVCFAVTITGQSGVEAASERDVKAAFLLNFTRFADWPPAAFHSPSAPFVVGIVGSDSIEQSLRDLLRNKTIGGRPVNVQRVDLRAVRSCHLVFLPAPNGDQAGEVLRLTEGFPVLTVGESEGFAERGGVINFVVRDRRVRFEINPQAAAASQLKISSKLLQLAILTGAPK